MSTSGTSRTTRTQALGQATQPAPVDGEPLAAVLDRVVAAGVLTRSQADAVLAEASGPVTTAATPSAGPARGRRTLSRALIEIGLYVGTALVVAALAVIVAQAWESLSHGSRVAIVAAVALATGVAGLLTAHGAAFATARRRLAGVLLGASAAAIGGTAALLLRDVAYVGTISLALTVAVVVIAQRAAPSAVTEVGLFAASYVLLQVASEELRPASTYTVDQWGTRIHETSTYDRLLPLGLVAFGLLWALLVSRHLIHRELALALGLGAGTLAAMTVAAEPPTRTVGLVTLAGLAALGFWRFLVEGLWPWIAAAVASLTAFVLWVTGGAQRPAVGILAAGLVMLASSGMAVQLGRWRHRRAERLQPPGASRGTQP